MEIIFEGKCPTWNDVLNKTAYHWSERKEIADTWHELVYWTVYQIENKPKLPFEKKVGLEFLIKYKGNKLRDPDGVSVKYILDGLVKAGVIKNDSYREIDYIKLKIENCSDKDLVILNIIEQDGESILAT